MKPYLIFTAVAILASGYPALAQDDRDNYFIGVKGGINYSNVYDSKGQEFDADAKLGFVAGGFLQVPLGSLFGIQPEVLFSQKGFVGSGVLLGTNYELTRTSNYLDVPIFLALKPSSKVTILAGPQFSFLLSQKDVFKGGGITVEQEQEFDNENIRKNTMCFIGGLDFNLGPLVLGTRAGWDFKSNHGDGTSSTPRYKNTWLQATIGLRI
jgi:hypothetical protein